VPTAVHRRGEVRFTSQPKGRRYQHSSCNIVVSNRSFSDFRGQVRDAVRFLKARRTEIRSLVRRPGVESALLDFGVARRPEAVVQVDAFPQELVSLAGGLGLALMLSLYPAPVGRK
jgi:hypothetical protein